MPPARLPVSVSKTSFKARALEIFREIEQSGQEVVITDRGRPVLKVVPFELDTEALLAPFRNSLRHFDHPTEPLDDQDWEVLR